MGNLVIRKVGFAALVTGYVMFVWIFISAYITPSKTTFVYINAIGEANLELAIIIITFPMIIYYFYTMPRE